MSKQPEKPEKEQPTQDEAEFRRNLEKLLKSPPKPNKPKDGDSRGRGD